MRQEDGWALVTAIMVMVVMLGFGLATLSYVDGDARTSGTERNSESSYDYSEGVLDDEGYLVSSQWPTSTSLAMPDCTYNGSSVTAAPSGGLGTNFCPAPTQLAQDFSSKEYSGALTWTVRIRDNGGTDTCALTGKPQCSYFYDDSVVSTQPSWDANGDGQLWVRAQALMWGRRRTLVQRVQLDQQAVNFPQAVVTAGHMALKGSPHIKVVTNFSPINLRCAINSSNCLVLKKQKQIAPYKISFSYPQQQAIPTSALDQLRKRAQAEGWYYSGCPTNPPGRQVFVESGTCTGASLPFTTPTQQGTYIQVSGTMTISGRQPNSGKAPRGLKGNYWGLLYMANQSKLTGDVLTVKNGRRLIRGVVAIDYAGGLNLGGSKDTLLQYDPFAIQGLYLYQGSTIVRPSFREIATSTP
jgi:Tfp pilus assembly protein PilX